MVDWAAKDAAVIAALDEMVSTRSRWGFWKCSHQLTAVGYEWKPKKMHRVYRAMKLNLQRKAKKRVITRERQLFLTEIEFNKMLALDFIPDAIYDREPSRTFVAQALEKSGEAIS